MTAGAASAVEHPRRALVLAGGGLRLSWQAGVLRALLEAGLRFHLVDATSAGGLNAAMWLSGQTPEEMAERWRAQRALRTMGARSPINYVRPSRMTAMGSAEPFRRHVIRSLGIDLERVRQAGDIEAWFNVLNYTRMQVECVPHTTLDEDVLVAGLSLPGLLPPVERDGALYLDAGFARDANPMEAVRRGADELWIAWAMASSPHYRGGPLQFYVQALEMSANTTLAEDLRRIEDLNEQVARGEHPLGRSTPVAAHLVRPRRRLPLDTDLYSGGTSAGSLIDRGYQDAWRYLDALAGGEASPATVTGEAEPDAAGATYRVSMRGPFAFGAAGPAEGARAGEAAGTSLALEVSAIIDDLELLEAGAEGAADVAGHVEVAGWPAALPARRGTLRLTGGRGARALEYRLAFVVDGRPVTLVARERAETRGAFDATLLEGHEDGGPVAAAGVLHVGRGDLARLAAGLRPSGMRGGPRSLARAQRLLLSHHGGARGFLRR